VRRGRAGRSGGSAWTRHGGLCAACVAVVVGCQKDPVVTTRTVTLHAPQGCAAGLADLDAMAYGVYRSLGDFDAPAPPGGHPLVPEGVALPEIDPRARALLVDATEGEGGREWMGLTGVAPSGAVDLLLLPELTSCAFHGPLTQRAGAVMAPVGGGRVLVVGGKGASGAALPATLALSLATGAVTPVNPDLATPRNGAAITGFGPGGLVSGGLDVHGAVLDRAEVYAPDRGGFEPDAIVLGAARASAGAVVLATGETLLVGGVGTDGTTALDSMEIVDPATRTARTTNVARLAVARIAPSVLRLASGEILVAGGVGSNGAAIARLEWFSADASQPTIRAEDLVAGSARAYVALQSGGALAVVAPPPGADGTFQNTWIIDADGVLEPAASIAGALSQPALFGGAGDAPVLWTGDRWLRWEPWLGTFGALGALDDVPAQVGATTASPDPGLALWVDPSNPAAPRVTALRFDVRGEYSPLSSPLLLSDAEDTSPDHLATDGAVTFDPALFGGALQLVPGASAFVTDRTYADVRIELDAPSGAPALLVLRDALGHELEVGGASCPGAVVTGSALTLVVERRGSSLKWSVSGNAPSSPCATPFAPDARLTIGVRGAPDLTHSVARNLRVTRLGAP
jgi:hypothetical protein